MDDQKFKKIVNEDLSFQHYVNSSPVFQVGGVDITVGDVVKAATLARLNTFLIGETGEGKTQLENDVLAWFGNKGLFVLGRNDMDLRDLFRQLNLGKIDELKKKGGSDKDLRELTSAVLYHIFVNDELTRCIPAVQNQLFNLFDGYIEIDGKKYSLGGGWCVGLASGNVGNGKYLGASDTDRALLDRMHVILDLDNFPTSSVDDIVILTKTNDPRVKDSEGKDLSTKIIDAHSELKKGVIPIVEYVASVYLMKGLDYLPDAPHSKRLMKNVWPNSVKGHDEGSDAGLIYPVSKRSAFSVLSLSQALKAVARSKGAESIDDLDTFFEAFRLTGSYSGILNQGWVNEEHYGNPYVALGALIDNYKKEFGEKKDLVARSIGMAQQGKLDDKMLSQFDGRWSFMKDVLSYVASNAVPAEGVSVENVEKQLVGGGAEQVQRTSSTNVFRGKAR